MTSSQITKKQLKCPFCGKPDIEYGLALCSSCHAEITYDTDVRAVAKHSPAFKENLDTRIQEVNDLHEKASGSNWFTARSIQKRAAILLQNIERDLAAEDARVMQKVDQYLADPARRRAATFTRGDRAIEIDIGPASPLQ